MKEYLNRISDALKKLFDRHRIVFWYDEGATMYDIFQSLDLEGVSKLEQKRAHLDELQVRDFEQRLVAMASRRITIDLDDGVRINYPKFGD